MNGIDNIAGYTLTAGAADFVITDSIAQYDPIIDNLDDGDERNYKAQFIDASMSTDYETGRGTWNATAGTISRDTIKTSSNNGAIVDFGAGPKVVFIVSDYESLTDMNNMVDSAVGAGSLKMTTAERATIAGLGDSSSLDVGTTAGTVAAGDDARFGEVDIGDLTPATSIDGTELVPADQGGDGVSITTQQIAGDPARNTRTHGMNYLQDYTDFHRTRVLLPSVDGSTCDLEPWTIHFSGVSAAVLNAKFFALRGLILSTGTDTTGYAAIQHMQSPIVFNPLYSLETIFKGGFNASNFPTVEASTVQIGFTSVATALATVGFYFEATSASSNWFAVVRADAGNVTRTDTGVAFTLDYTKRFRILFDADNSQTLFYINEALVATILEATRIPPTSTNLYITSQIRKSAGTNLASTLFSDHFYKIEASELVGF